MDPLHQGPLLFGGKSDLSTKNVTCWLTFIYSNGIHFINFIKPLVYSQKVLKIESLQKWKYIVKYCFSFVDIYSYILLKSSDVIWQFRNVIQSKTNRMLNSVICLCGTDMMNTDEFSTQISAGMHHLYKRECCKHCSESVFVVAVESRLTMDTGVFTVPSSCKPGCRALGGRIHSLAWVYTQSGQETAGCAAWG